MPATTTRRSAPTRHLSLPPPAPAAARPPHPWLRRVCMLGGIAFAAVAVAVVDRLLSPRGPDALPLGVVAAAALAAALVSVALGRLAVRLSDDSPDDDAPAPPRR